MSSTNKVASLTIGKTEHSKLPQHNKSLISRGSLTFWVDAVVMNNWFHHDHHGRWERSLLYTGQTLMHKGIFSFSLRATQGLLDSLF